MSTRTPLPLFVAFVAGCVGDASVDPPPGGDGAANAPPTVALTSPAEAAVVGEGADVTVTATAGDSDGAVTLVELLVNGAPVAQTTGEPFTFSWAAAPAGRVTLTARATDDGGATAISAPVAVTVIGAAQVYGTLSVQLTTGQPPGPQGGVRGRAVYLWIEDLAGNYIDTVHQYFGRVMTGDCLPDELHYTCLGYRYYDDPCWDWHAASAETGLLQPSPTLPPDPVTGALSIDGVTGASVLPQPGGLPASSGTVTLPPWDGLDRAGNPIAQGTYVVQLEITWERADGLGHTRPCETYPGTFPCNFRYSASIELGDATATASFTPTDWMVSASQLRFVPH